MADLDEISSELLEALEPIKKEILLANGTEYAWCLESARSKYVSVENRLHEFLARQCGIGMDALEKSPTHPLSRVILPLYQEIKEGYSRVSDMMG